MCHIRRQLDKSKLKLCAKHVFFFSFSYFVCGIQAAVVFTANVWHADVLFNKVTHSPGHGTRRQSETEISLPCSFMQEKKSETGSGNKSSGQSKWITASMAAVSKNKTTPSKHQLRLVGKHEDASFYVLILGSKYPACHRLTV